MGILKVLSSITGEELDWKDEKGFSLIETLVSLLILTLIGGSFLTFYAISDYIEREYENKNNFYFGAYSLGQELLYQLYKEDDEDLICLLTEPKTVEELYLQGYEFNTVPINYTSEWKISANNIHDLTFSVFEITIKNQNGSKLIFNYAEPGHLFDFGWGGGPF